MIATLDRLMALSQKLHDAERTHESDPVYIALEMNELQVLQRTLDVYLSELDAAAYRPGVEGIEAYD